MADAISPCRHQCFWQWHDWPSSALAAHGRQHYCSSGPVRPLPDNYALVTAGTRLGYRVWGARDPGMASAGARGGLGAEPPAGSRGRAPGRGSGG